MLKIRGIIEILINKMFKLLSIYGMKSPFRIVFIFITCACIGIATIPYLNVDFLPQIKSNSLSIAVQFPNASPALVESQVIQVLENACSSILGLKHINSISRYDHGEITLEFDARTDMAMASFELTTIIRRIYPTLPVGVSYPIINRINSSTHNDHLEEKPTLVYAIHAPEQPFAIKAKAEEIFRKELSSFRDLKEIRFSGTEELQVTIRFVQDMLTRYHLQVRDIDQQLNDQFKVSYPGVAATNQDHHEYFLRTSSTTWDISSIENLVIPIGAHSILLKDIAKIFIENQPISSYFRTNGKNSIVLMLYARDGTNRLILADALKIKMMHLINALPIGYQMYLDHDDTIFLKEELYKNYRRSISAVAILIVFLLISYRSWRHLFIVFLSLIVNLALTAGMCYILKIPIHLYSIAGISISFGIMIDNSIVTLDYFHQYRSRHIFLAVLAATLTTVVSLLLVFLLPDELKQNLSDFASVISIALGVSLLISLFFTPSLYFLFYPVKNQLLVREGILDYSFNKGEQLYYNLIRFILRYRKIFILISILSFGLPVFLLPFEWKGHPWYNKTAGNEWYLEHVRPVVDRVLGGSLRLFVRNVYEKSGYRDPQRTQLFVRAEMKFGTTIEQMNTILSQFEKYLEGVKGIDQYVTNVYSGQYGNIQITFTKDFENSALPWQLKSRLTAKATDWSAVEWGIYGVGLGFSTYNNDKIPSYRVMMKGYNHEELERQANVLKQKLMRHPRIQKVNTNERLNWSERASWEYVLNLDEQTMAAKSISKEQLFTTVNDISQTRQTGQMLQYQGKSYPIVIKEEGSGSYDLWDMKNKPLQIDAVSTFKLNQISDLELVPTSSAMYKENRQYMRLVAFEYLGSEHFGSKYLDQVLDEMKDQLPIGYRAERQTRSWDIKDKAKPYGLLLLMILAIYFICALMFENLKFPFYIILMIPLSFVGLFLTFALGEFYFDQGGYAAFVMLAGLVVNAAIFILHDYQQAIKLEPGEDTNILLIKIVSNRARTIILTTLSTICSLLPFIYEGQREVFWFSLAVGVMGGLVFSMYAVFVVLVVMSWKKGASKF